MKPANTEFVTYYVMKKDSMYLEDVWEEWSEDINFSFTEDLSNAMIFFEHTLSSDWGAPKYLWNDVTNKNIKTVEEMCNYFNGNMVKVYKKTIWEEVIA